MLSQPSKAGVSHVNAVSYPGRSRIFRSAPASAGRMGRDVISVRTIGERDFRQPVSGQRLIDGIRGAVVEMPAVIAYGIAYAGYAVIADGSVEEVDEAVVVHYGRRIERGLSFPFFMGQRRKDRVVRGAFWLRQLSGSVGAVFSK